MNPEVLPQRPLNLLAEMVRLAPPETSTREHMEATLDYLEARMDKWTSEQDRRLLKAEKRIKLCAFLHGMILASGFPEPEDYYGRPRHFSWCPFEAWMGNEPAGLSELFGHRH